MKEKLPDIVELELDLKEPESIFKCLIGSALYHDIDIDKEEKEVGKNESTCL